MTRETLLKILANHGIEVWEGYAVECYSMANGNNPALPGESFIALNSFKTVQDVRIWLGY